MNWSWSIFWSIAAGACAIATVFAQSQKDKHEKTESDKQTQKLLTKTEEISAKNDTIAQLNAQIAKDQSEKSDELLALSKQLARSDQQLVELTEELMNQLTGGNSVPLVTLSFDNLNDIRCRLVNRGKYAVRNLTVEYTLFGSGWNVLDSGNFARTDFLSNSTEQFHTGKIPDIDTDTDCHWRIFVRWRNGGYHLKIPMNRDEGYWKMTPEYVWENGDSFDPNVYSVSH